MHQFRCRGKPWKREMAAWDCKSSSLIVSCASSPRVLSWADLPFGALLGRQSSVWIHQHLYSLPVPSSSPPSLLMEHKYNLSYFLLSLYMRLLGWVGEPYLAAAHTGIVKQFEWVLLKPKWLDCLKKPFCKENKISYLKGLSSWRFWYVIASHSTLSECSKYRMSQNVLLTLGQSYW